MLVFISYENGVVEVMFIVEGVAGSASRTSAVFGVLIDSDSYDSELYVSDRSISFSSSKANPDS